MIHVFMHLGRLVPQANQALDEAIDTEAQAQARCMRTNDFHRAYNAFLNKQKPEFKGD